MKVFPKSALLSRFRNISSNVGWLIGQQGLNLVLSLLTIPLMARFLGPSNYGILTAYTAALAIISPLASGGVDSLLAKHLVEHPEEEHRALGNATLVLLVGNFVALIVALGYVFYRWHKHDTAVEIQAGIAVTCILIFRLQMVPTAYLQARMVVKRAARAQAVATTVTHGGRLMAVLAKAPVAAFGWVVTFGTGLVGLVMLHFEARSAGMPRPGKWSYDLREAWNWRRSALVLGFTGVMTMVYRTGGQLFVAEFLGNREAGLYGGVARLAEFAGLVPVALNTTLFPLLVRARAADRKVYENRILQLLRLQSFLTIGMALVISCFAHTVLGVFYGREFEPASGVLSFYIWTCVLVAQINTKTQVLLAEGAYGVMFRWTIITAVMNIGLNLWLIPQHGMTGAAIASIVSYVFLAFVATFLDPKFQWLGKLQLKALATPFPRLKGLV